MLKKILAVFLASLMVFGVASAVALAEDPAPVEDTYNIADLATALAAAQESEEDDQVVVLAAETVSLTGAANETLLIVNYVTNPYDGSESYSAGEYKSFNDYNQTTGYAFKTISDMTTHAIDKNNQKVTNKNIDFASEEGTFVGWEVTYVYSDTNFNEITLCAIWEVEEIGGWEGFYAAIVNYIDILTNYFINLFKESYAAFVDWMNN